MQEERRFISELKPEYNQTLGGEGTLGFKTPIDVLKKRSEKPSSLRGRKRPPEVIAKMSAALKGKKLNLSEENREIRRKQAIYMVSIKKQYNRPPSEKQIISGRKANELIKRKVRCMNDGKIFSCTINADKFYGLYRGSASAIASKARGKTRNGLIFEYVNDI